MAAAMASDHESFEAGELESAKRQLVMRFNAIFWQSRRAGELLVANETLYTQPGQKERQKWGHRRVEYTPWYPSEAEPETGYRIKRVYLPLLNAIHFDVIEMHAGRGAAEEIVRLYSRNRVVSPQAQIKDGRRDDAGGVAHGGYEFPGIDHEQLARAEQALSSIASQQDWSQDTIPAA